MMKYREAIRRSLKKGDVLGFDNICFCSFLESISVMRALRWKQVLRTERTGASIVREGEDKPLQEDDGKVIDEPTIDDYVSHSYSLTPAGFEEEARFKRFLEWLMEQECDEDVFEKPWYGVNELIEKWNKCCECDGKRKQRRKKSHERSGE